MTKHGLWPVGQEVIKVGWRGSRLPDEAEEVETDYLDPRNPIRLI
jgi:hypothetical protein